VLYDKLTISIAHNPIQHDRTKHIEIDRHFIKEELDNGLITTTYILLHQLAEVLVKGLPSKRFDQLTGKGSEQWVSFQLIRQAD
jgi:hypothetical protein